MTTALQTQSNLRNAQFSTGPASAEGKARVTGNALRHGYCAGDIVMPNEDRAAFDTMNAEVQDTWQPANGHQRELADEIAAALWRRRRLRRTEAELWTARADAEREDPRTLGEALAVDCDSNANAIEKLRRWWVANERHLNRCQERLALMKRLERQMGGSNRPPSTVDERREESRALTKQVDRLLQAPVPYVEEQPSETLRRIGKSAEQTQSRVPVAEQRVVTAAATVAAPVSQNAAATPAVTEPRTRTERRALMRAQKKLEKRMRKSA